MKINWTALSEEEDVYGTLLYQRPDKPRDFRRWLAQRYPEIDLSLSEKGISWGAS